MVPLLVVGRVTETATAKVGLGGLGCYILEGLVAEDENGVEEL